MEKSVNKFIENKSNAFEEYLIGLLKNHPEIKSPINKIFFLEWHFQQLFIPQSKYFFFPEFHQKGITGNYRVDFMVVKHDFSKHIAIEVDGHDFHEKTKAQVRKDKIRERFITKNVTKLLRFSGSEVFKDPQKAINEVLCLIINIEGEY